MNGLKSTSDDHKAQHVEPHHYTTRGIMSRILGAIWLVVNNENLSHEAGSDLYVPTFLSRFVLYKVFHFKAPRGLAYLLTGVEVVLWLMCPPGAQPAPDLSL